MRKRKNYYPLHIECEINVEMNVGRNFFFSHTMNDKILWDFHKIWKKVGFFSESWILECNLKFISHSSLKLLISWWKAQTRSIISHCVVKFPPKNFKEKFLLSPSKQIGKLISKKFLHYTRKLQTGKISPRNKFFKSCAKRKEEIWLIANDLNFPFMIANNFPLHRDAFEYFCIRFWSWEKN